MKTADRHLRVAAKRYEELENITHQTTGWQITPTFQTASKKYK